ncbi:cytochrome P450 [Dermatobacter hominis]|uniref:cytochrome P450 n=1 Tax=Dermatobacter hominis TaxID=2884263 RepID=UPI001D0F66AB|nr:cytochrome P450 [Dermatobacter hominis]UDY36631.1 cytochrome P450 [Dermatobacter hominis]
MSPTAAPELYYDPFDFEIDDDPYPVWKRLRDEAPLYYNEKYDFWALSRFHDVEEGLKDWRRFSSAKGTLLELIKADIELPPGTFIFEDPPAHDLHRGLLSRVFTPRRMAAIEPDIRAFCARSLDPFTGSGGFDVIADLGAQVPMRTIGMLLGIPESDQEALRDEIDGGLKLDGGEMPSMADGLDVAGQTELFADYIDFRYAHPADDVMTDLITAEYTDEDGQQRRLTKEEALGYINLVAAAGNETTNRLIGWTTRLLALHPDQRRLVRDDRSLINPTIEEVLRYESPSPVQARYVTEDVELHGTVVAEGSALLLLNGSGNRDERAFEDPDRFDVRRDIAHHLAFGYGIHFCLGAALARIEGRVVLDEMLDRFPEWDLDEERAVRGRTSTVRGWETMPILI